MNTDRLAEAAEAVTAGHSTVAQFFQALVSR
jgi:hypothetical protein